MGHARYLGRVGALAVTLGIGVAMAGPHGVAHADPSADSSTSSSQDAASPNAPADAVTPDGSDGTDSTAPERKSPPVSIDAATVTVHDRDATDGDDEAAPSKTGDEAAPSATDDEAAPSTTGDDEPPARDETKTVPTPTATKDTVVPSARGSKNVHAPVTPNPPDDVATTVSADVAAPTPTDRRTSRVASVSAVVEDPGSGFSASVPPRTLAANATTALVPAPTVAPRPPTLIGAITDFVAGVLQPLLNPGTGSPIQIPILTAVLSLIRTEFDRIFAPRRVIAPSAPAPTLLVDPTDQHVLVIGVDGTNLSRILADDYNQNFLALMNSSTTAASSIVGHTTISNPSWTAILTGVWGERTGVVNNVFTPWTYDAWPTVFNQLEGLDRDIRTMTVADWDVINAISEAGSIPVDTNTYVPQLPGDTNWLATDDAVADKTIAAISAAESPNFLFSYYVGVDENGHSYGGASEEYRLAIRNMDDNLGDILAAVNASGEQWTIMIVTDHGHQPQKGFGHGFQSPDETSTFVIANGAGFGQGLINLQYAIVDTTPTVVSFFGGTPRPGSDGVPLTSLGSSDVDPVDLTQALKDAIALNGYPDVVTNIALGLRTIAATIPYYVYLLGNDVGAALPSFLVAPVKLFFDGLYVITNVPAQIVALLTGVSGASIFPLFPPAPPMFPPSHEATVMAAAQVCDAAVGMPEAAWCGVASVA